MLCVMSNHDAQHGTPYRAPQPLPPPPTERLFTVARVVFFVTVACFVANCIVFMCLLVFNRNESRGFQVFIVIGMSQLVSGVLSMVLGFFPSVYRARGWAPAIPILGFMSAVGAFFGTLFGLFAAGGGGWGRPLRVRGRIMHPELTHGSDWTEGDAPDISDLGPPSRAALEALWLHDAQKEHASVPAFGRIGWWLVAVGAPAELVAWAHRSALEEIDHTRRCFALAAAYGGRSHSVQPMPELLVGESDVGGDAIARLAQESLEDGCLLEDYNADIAGLCAVACRAPVTRDVLQRIAREERSHADFSWAVLTWLLATYPDRTRAACERAIAKLAHVARPTAVSTQKRALVARADVAELRRHGRIDDAEWARAWDERLAETRRRAHALLAGAEHASATNAAMLHERAA